MRIRAIISLCVVYAVAVVMVAGAKAATLPNTAQIVPAETILLVDIGDFNGLMKQLEKSSVYRLYKDPAMAAFMESFTGKFRQKFLQNDNPVIKTILDANGLPEGKTAFALVPSGSAGADGELSILVICQCGRNIDRLKEAIEKMAAKAVEKGAHRAIENYRDVNIVTLTTESAPTRVPDLDNSRDGNISIKPSSPPPEKDCFCFIDDCLIVASDVDTVKFVVAHIQGAASSSLAGNADYVLAMGDVGPYHDVDLFLNFRQLLTWTTAKDKSGQTRMEMANLGFDNLAGLGFSLGVNANNDGSIRGKAVLKTTGTRKGVLKMLETRTEPIRPPRFIPASASSVSILNLDIKRAFDEFCSIMYGFNPVSAAVFQQPLVEAGRQGEPPVTLKADIIEYLGSEIVIAQSINKPFSISAIPTETLIAVSVNNRASLEKSLSLVHKRLMAPNNPQASRELLGHTIYLLGPMGFPTMGGAAPLLGGTAILAVSSRAGSPCHAAQSPAPGPQTNAPLVRTAFTITDTHLIMGPEPAVERAIRTLSGAEADSVGSAEWFAKAKSAVPSVVGLACLEDTSASGELLWWMLREGSKRQRANVGIGSTASVLAQPDLWQSADFSLLPDFGAVRKYFGYSVLYGVSRSDGFLFEFKYLNPKAGDNH